MAAAPSAVKQHAAAGGMKASVDMVHQLCFRHLACSSRSAVLSCTAAASPE
jgi:hypothetical protein